MIYIIFAPPRYGKTSFLAHIMNSYAFNNDRNRLMRRELEAKNNAGFNLSIPKHCVSTNFDLVFRRFGYSPRHNRRINPYRLGFANDRVKTHFNFPYECIGITEAQKYLNSRMSKYYPEWQSRWYEQHGHNSLDIFLDTQRPNLIDVNIRELAKFIEIRKLDIVKNSYGVIQNLCWTIRVIENSSAYEKYIATGKTNRKYYKQLQITADYNVFNIYDSQSCKPKFYDGHLDEDFDYIEGKTTPQTLQGYVEYLQTFDDELPDKFYNIKGGKVAWWIFIKMNSLTQHFMSIIKLFLAPLIQPNMCLKNIIKRYTSLSIKIWEKHLE